MNLQGRTVLVVEDEAIVAMDVAMRLCGMGLTVRGPVDTGRAALAACEEGGIDAILMDVRLRGEIDGIETAARIGPRWGIPIIFLTAYSDAHTLDRITEVEPYGYLLKPFDERALWVTLHTALRRHEQELARARAEHERHRSDARFRAILDHSHDGIISVDRNQRVVIFNRGAEAIFGYSASDALGMSLDALVPDASVGRHRMLVDAVVQGEVVSRPMTLREVEGRRASGATFPIEVSLSRLCLDGEVMVTAIVRDLTERKRLEAQFHHAQKLETLGRLASSIAHDFNNQLVPIGGYAELLCRALDENDQRRADAQEIRAATERAARLTRQLLMFGRRDLAQATAVTVDELLQELSGMLARLVGGDITVHMELCAARAQIHLDPSFLEQIVMNLVVNARDAMPQGGHITVTTGVVDHTDVPEGTVANVGDRFVVLRVSDTGMGVPEDLRSKVFEPFFTTKPAGLGTGLGLSTILGIVQQAAGTVALDSRIGEGTTLSAYFPLFGFDDAANPAPGSRPIRLKGTLPFAVLVVDDDDAVRRFVGRVLRQAGYHVSLARTPRQAISVCPDPVHLVVTELVLPGMLGPELASQLVTRHDCGVLYMTGYRDEELLKRGLPPPDSALLRKPFGAQMLEQAVLEQQQRARRTARHG